MNKKWLTGLFKKHQGQIYNLPGSQTETKAESGSAVSHQTVKRHSVDVDVFNFVTPFQSFADWPRRIASSQQQERISAECAGHDDGRH